LHTHVPGQSPRAAEEELFGESERDLFCWGIDLFNGGCYWEAHETWEALWHAAGRVGPTADFLKGLIKLAAAGVKLREGRPAGLRRHADRARELFFGLPATEPNASWRRWGLPPEQLAQWAKRIALGELVRWDELRASWPGRPARIFDFELQPQIDG
jgi:hypothetical protein